MEMTVEELASRTGMTARNIREWQTNGLLPAPERRGRHGVYNDDHVSRIERIKALRTQRFPLHVIKQMLDRSVDTEQAVRRLATEVLDPTNLTGTMELKRADVELRLGHDWERHLAACGLVEPNGDEVVTVTDTVTFDYVDKLVAIGLPLDKVAKTLITMSEHQLASVRTLVDLYRDEIWRPFVEAGLPADRLHAVADKTTQLRPLTVGLGIQAFRRAVDDVVGKVAAEEAARLDD